MLVSNSPKFEVIGHRGNPGNPLNSINIENTVGSFEDAWKLGADGIELDVILSKDGSLMVHHDDKLGRVFIMPDSNEQGFIGEYSVGELGWKTVPNIKNLGSQYKGLEVRNHLTQSKHLLPTLDCVLIPKGKKLFLELKFINDKYDKDSVTDKKYLENLVSKAVWFIEEHDLTDQVAVLCFVPEALDRVRELNPGITTAYNVYQREADSPIKIKQAKKDFGFTVMNPPFEQATKEAINNMHSEGLRTYPWAWKQSPQEEIDETVRLIKDGADGSINNQVKAALEVRDKYSVRV